MAANARRNVSKDSWRDRQSCSNERLRRYSRLRVYQPQRSISGLPWLPVCGRGARCCRHVHIRLRGIECRERQCLQRTGKRRKASDDGNDPDPDHNYSDDRIDGLDHNV